MSFVSLIIEVSSFELLSSLKAFPLYLPMLIYLMAFLKRFLLPTRTSNVYRTDKYVLMDCVCRWTANQRLQFSWAIYIRSKLLKPDLAVTVLKKGIERGKG